MNLTQRIVAGAVTGVALLAPAVPASAIPPCLYEVRSPVVIRLSNPPQVVVQQPPYLVCAS